jgi:hypothetical protein
MKQARSLGRRGRSVVSRIAGEKFMAAHVRLRAHALIRCFLEALGSGEASIGLQ